MPSVFKKQQKGGGGRPGEYITRLDPSEVRFTHSKIRPVFSDGRLLEDTLAEIQAGKLNPDKMCNITVIQQDGYFVSMNNRRLWVLKAAHAKGLLKEGKVQVRVQQPQDTKRLKDRFDVEKCSLTATFLRERIKKAEPPSADSNDTDGNVTEKQTEAPGIEDDVI